ncbi:MAG: hypothetical protein II007_13335 [Gammaproteobacteria bacterium]|nr:hypothetical protein [Gammaproteobacteria bacterium]
MANFGSSLARAAGAGLLQYGQFKYQEQLDAMREANLAKREAARMEFEKGQRSEDRAMRGQERKEDRDLRGKERSEDMQLTREQMGQQASQFDETMGYKRVDDMNGAFDSVEKEYKDTLAMIEKAEIEGMADDPAKVQEAEAAAWERRSMSMGSLFNSYGDFAKSSRYWGSEPHSQWLQYQQQLAPAPTEAPAVPPTQDNPRSGMGLLMKRLGTGPGGETAQPSSRSNPLGVPQPAGDPRLRGFTPADPASAYRQAYGGGR